MIVVEKLVLWYLKLISTDCVGWNTKQLISYSDFKYLRRFWYHSVALGMCFLSVYFWLWRQTSYQLFIRFNLENSWYLIFPIVPYKIRKVQLIALSKSFLTRYISSRGRPETKPKSADYGFRPDLGDEKINPRIFHADFQTQRVKLHQTRCLT